MSQSSNHSTQHRRTYTRRSETQWQELIEGFAGSGLSLEAYCQQNKIAPSGFYKWRRRFEEPTKPNEETDKIIDITPSFADSVAPQKQKMPVNVELELAPGFILRIYPR